MNEHIGCKHPCLYRFLENVIEIQGFQELRVAKIEGGEEPERKRTYRDYEARLKNMVDNYNKEFEDDELIRYVRSIASVLKFDLTIKKKNRQCEEKENEDEEEEEVDSVEMEL